MKLLLKLVLALAIAGATQPVYANFSGEFNGAKIDDEWGAELGVGYSIVNVKGLRVTPIVGVFITKDDDSPYYWDNNGGSKRCRNGNNGQYANDSDCISADFAGYAGGEVTYSFESKFTVGGGAIYIHEDIKPYGTVGVNVSKNLSIKGKAGKDYVAAGVHFGF